MGVIRDAAKEPIVIIKRRAMFVTDFHSRTCPVRDTGATRALYCHAHCLTYEGRHKA